ncbi:RNA polymerase factor sigma-54 [Paenibacillus solisilvae]|uniref:RNA polymerase factor sigma-54 n=1 Tax=Paenibacillus solisilvae TaxID=2486751 RepID=A0ABW0VZM0_9BACL
MKLSYGLAAAQIQQLKLTNALKQGIDMLRMSEAELASFLQEAIINNPLLELTYSDHLMGYGRNTRLKTSLDSREPQFNIPKESPTLQDVVVGQLAYVSLSVIERKIAFFLAGNLDECGYLRISVEESALQLGCKPGDVQSVLTILQSLEPAGIASRNLPECLQLQIERNPLAPPDAKIVVGRYLSDLAKSRWQQIADDSGIPIPTLKQILNYVRTLNPKPGLAYAASPSVYIAADAIIFREGEHFAVRLNGEAYPTLSLHLESETGSHLQDDPESFAYYRTNRQEAWDLVRNVKRRKKTLLSVIGSICHEQQQFLKEGPTALKPLNLKTISEATGLHLSTVSRAVQNKFVQTPWGLFELHYFFAQQIGTQSDESASASDRQVKLHIKAIIEKEHKTTPYSDQQITGLLKDEGFVISRRTVAKYRDEMNILSAIYRRQI